MVPGAGEGECCSLLLPGDGSGTGPGACRLSPCTAGCVLHGSLLGWTVTLTVARCAEHSCSSGSPGKAPSPLERFGAGVCSTVRGCVRLGRVLQAPWRELGTGCVPAGGAGLSLGSCAGLCSWLCVAQAHPERMQILVAVVRYKTRLSKPRRGLCSTWLASLNPQQGECLDCVRVPQHTVLIPRARDGAVWVLTLCRSCLAGAAAPWGARWPGRMG